MNSHPPTDPLAELRGWHLPEPVPWWPPAPGWWVSAILLVLLVAAAAWYWARGRRARAAAVAARRELAELHDTFARDGDGSAFARGLSRLLRRFAIARFPRREVAGLAGADWLAFLDEHGGAGRFLTGPGRLLADAPHRPATELPADELTELVADWISRNAVRRG